MDELGRFERHNQDFIACVHDLLSSSKTVLAVIKDEPIPYPVSYTHLYAYSKWLERKNNIH